MSEAASPDSLRPHLALALVPGLGPRLTAALLAHFGSPEAILHATPNQLEAVPMIGATLAARFGRSFATIGAAVDREWALLQKHHVNVGLPGSALYPEMLTTIPDAPTVLYSRGTFEEVDANAVGIVGSRSCTAYGRRMAAQIASSLARAGWTVVSGLARGIDGAAHQAALDAGGRTLAVLAGGLSRIYPPEHADLAEACVRQGAILTETPMSVDPQPGMFPARNRIISGLSRGIVVIEADVRSGALITATHAAEQGREVFALAGNADSSASAGCLELIRKGARLIRSADDILEDLRGIAPPVAPTPRPQRYPAAVPQSGLFDLPPQQPAAPVAAPALSSGPPPGLDPVQMGIWEALATSRHADDLSRELAIPSNQLMVELTRLEMKRVVRRMPGNTYERR